MLIAQGCQVRDFCLCLTRDPRGSMGLVYFRYICFKDQQNVCKYTRHGSYGHAKSPFSWICSLWNPLLQTSVPSNPSPFSDGQHCAFWLHIKRWGCQDVNFHYPHRPEVKVLRHLSFRVEKGQSAARSLPFFSRGKFGGLWGEKKGTKSGN